MELIITALLLVVAVSCLFQRPFKIEIRHVYPPVEEKLTEEEQKRLDEEAQMANEINTSLQHFNAILTGEEPDSDE